MMTKFWIFLTLFATAPSLYASQAHILMSGNITEFKNTSLFAYLDLPDSASQTTIAAAYEIKCEIFRTLSSKEIRNKHADIIYCYKAYTILTTFEKAAIYYEFRKVKAGWDRAGFRLENNDVYLNAMHAGGGARPVDLEKRYEEAHNSSLRLDNEVCRRVGDLWHAENDAAYEFYKEFLHVAEAREKEEEKANTGFLGSLLTIFQSSSTSSSPSGQSPKLISSPSKRENKPEDPGIPDEKAFSEKPSSAQVPLRKKQAQSKPTVHKSMLKRNLLYVTIGACVAGIIAWAGHAHAKSKKAARKPIKKA